MFAFQDTTSVSSRFLVGLVLVTFTAWCSNTPAMQTYNMEKIADEVTIGDRIEITLKNSSKESFQVTEISETGINGENEFVSYADIQEIKIVQTVKARSSGTNSKVVGGVLVAALLVGLLVYLVSNISPGFPAP